MLYVFPRVAVIEQRDGYHPNWAGRGVTVLECREDMSQAEDRYNRFLSDMMSVQYKGEIRLAIYPADKYGDALTTPYMVLRYIDTTNTRRR
jgi:hypothetical protein